MHTLPNAKAFEHHGLGKLTQTTEGTVLDVTVYGQPTHIEWKAAELESVHIEYDSPSLKGGKTGITSWATAWIYPLMRIAIGFTLHSRGISSPRYPLQPKKFTSSP